MQPSERERLVSVRALARTLPLLHHHARRAQQLAIENIADLIHLRDKMIFSGAFSRRRGEGFMHRRIERMTNRINDFKSVSSERLEQLLFDQHDALLQPRRVGRARIHVRHTSKVIEGVEYAANEQAHAFQLCLLTFSHGALPEVVILGSESQVPILLLNEFPSAAAIVGVAVVTVGMAVALKS